MSRRKNPENYEDREVLDLSQYGSARECKARLDEIHTAVDGRDLTDPERAEWEALAERAKRYEEAERLSLNPKNLEGPIGRSNRREANVLRDTAMRNLETHLGSGLLHSRGAEAVERLMGHPNHAERTLAQRWAAATGSPEYASAFAKIVSDPYRGHMLWSREEQQAVADVREVRAAMAITATHGAELVPLTLDPTILLTNAGTANSLLDISRVVQTATGQWKGVSSAGATSEWLAEATEAADGSPVLDDIPIPVHKAAVDVIWSYEVEQDASQAGGGFLSEVQRVAQDAVTNMIMQAYTTGSGTGQPKGFVTALAGTASEINTAGTEALHSSDPFVLQNSLGARFSPNASFQSHIATANTYRQMETANGSLYFPELRANPPTLAGKPWYENSHMDGTINTAATANNYALVYGDFSQFVIVNQIGALFEVLPGYGANRRPTAQRHGFLTFRTGSDVTMIEAFRLLDVPTTA